MISLAIPIINYVITGIFVIEIYEEENLLFEILLSWIVLKILVKVAENR